jgi:hypothetical protein
VDPDLKFIDLFSPPPAQLWSLQPHDKGDDLRADRRASNGLQNHYFLFLRWLCPVRDFRPLFETSVGEEEPLDQAIQFTFTTLLGFSAGGLIDVPGIQPRGLQLSRLTAAGLPNTAACGPSSMVPVPSRQGAGMHCC